MSKIVTFGEIMLRLAPKGYLRFLQEPEFQATFGGGEANVAVSLANYGLDAAFVTKLPENPIGEAAIRELLSCSDLPELPVLFQGVFQNPAQKDRLILWIGKSFLLHKL